MREKIKAILERLEYSGIRAIDYQRCEVAEVQIQSALTELEALFIAEQKQWGEDLIDYLNYRLSEYTEKEHLFEVIKKWGD